MPYSKTVAPALTLRMAQSPVLLERIYDTPHQQGYRVLVDRLWPRGIAKENAALDEWCKDLAPTSALRTWFGHKPEHWDEFQHKYTQELKTHTEAATALIQRAGTKKLILIYAAKDREHTHALTLRAFLLTLPALQAKLKNPTEMTSPVCYLDEVE